MDIFGTDVPKKIKFVLKKFLETQKMPSIEISGVSPPDVTNIFPGLPDFPGNRPSRISRPAKENPSIHYPIPPLPPASPFQPQQSNNT
jgi:hypothetical protein